MYRQLINEDTDFVLQTDSTLHACVDDVGGTAQIHGRWPKLATGWNRVQFLQQHLVDKSTLHQQLCSSKRNGT